MAFGDVARGEAEMLGWEVHGHSTATDVGPGCFEEDVVVGVRMRIRYDLAPTADGVVITHRLSAQLPGAHRAACCHSSCAGDFAICSELRSTASRLTRKPIAPEPSPPFDP
jgi:hypothetical protein